ncbi:MULTISPECIES: glycerol-3-phosphate dehydrogenase/oxidase [unclassified Mesorhizobium]|uniref:glycerol-3-phosphate dehydrogenase/oxidase n=1 Tax=unclassified Mesorhizobium TaxID=325217 RepID=UPI001CCF582C|nr:MULTISPECIES: glycerol-3-phosphate dehydrogenase/oxidase [unclassified Mesorhizobium]MBZ9738766.1 glycerol-3-phosphate dehydrogenase/oxidase [Mesorhizobium sp. CO1-1-4]MBZ9802932.1 glycerol-3-phosphate dehydrogenase/oxidase [Mesorhizobium sp. ES1-6]
MNRSQITAGLRDRPDIAVLVIGGGINGISVFRELALQGVDVVLAEKGDYCCGASAALSRMVHGGLRYLENGEFKLVRESLLERDRLLRNAPHYVAPLPTTVPIFDIFSGLANGAVRFLGLTRRPSRRGALVIKTGLAMYDLFTSARRLMPTHRFRGRTETLKTWPAINPAIRNSATYYDAWVSRPERLGLEMLLEATASGARALNYAKVSSSGEGLAITDTLTGERLPVRPRLIVNATGGWIDLTNQAIGASAPRMMGGTKGSHLIVDNAELHAALGGHMVYYENEDGRICILFPYLGKVLIGSTDIRVDDPDQVRCEEDEQRYILQSLAFVFPSVKIGENQIVFRFAGVRPLPASDDSFTGRIPRDHFCEFVEAIGHLPATLCMIGGKWTTFRSFGALAADSVLERLGLERSVGTEDMAIGGGRDFPADPERWCASFALEYGLSVERARMLLQRYGTSARKVVAHPAGEQMLPRSDYSAGEIRQIIEHEQVECLADLFLRRTTIAISGGLSFDLINAVLDMLAAHKGWNASEAAAECSTFLALLADRHGIDLQTHQRSALCA